MQRATADEVRLRKDAIIRLNRGRVSGPSQTELAAKVADEIGVDIGCSNVDVSLAVKAWLAGWSSDEAVAARKAALQGAPEAARDAAKQRAANVVSAVEAARVAVADLTDALNTALEAARENAKTAATGIMVHLDGELQTALEVAKKVQDEAKDIDTLLAGLSLNSEE
jgi:hypothetical protein